MSDVKKSGTVYYVDAAAAVAYEKWAADMDADGFDGAQIVADYQAMAEEVSKAE